ncbi:MAG TPA: glycosyltransferase [Thermoanaerobaculia bacterium]|nr:glycosyltransferase [Thermoanaerobaculia bacterium]
MNLLVVTEFLRRPEYNGSEVACRALVEALRRRHRVDVVARADGDPVPGDVAFPVDEPTRADPERLARFLAERIDLGAYDLVYNLGALSFGCEVVACLRPREAEVPLVNHFQALLAPYARAELRPRARQREHAAAQMEAAARAALNVFLSPQEVREALAFGYDLASGGVAVIPNGLPLEEFDAVEPDDSFLPPARRGEGQRPLVVAAAGRFSDYAKGADLAYRAFVRLHRQRQDVFLLVLANKDRFAYLLRDLPADSYALLPWQPRPRFLSLLAAADLVVVPSRYEPFGLVALEAHLLGLPVVANAVGGLAEIVHHGESGLLNPLEQGSLGLGLALARLAAAPERRAMGERGRRRARREYSLERVGALVEQALERARLPADAEVWLREAAR